MYKECKTLKSSERQKQFEVTLLKMMEAQSFKDITVTALCRELGAPRKAFYRYFEEMEDVLNALMDEILLAAFMHVEGQIELEKFFAYWKKQKTFLDVLEKNGLSQKMMDRAFALMMSTERLDGQSGKGMKYAGYISAILTMIVMWHHSGMKQSVEEMKNLVVEMFSGDSTK